MKVKGKVTFNQSGYEAFVWCSRMSHVNIEYFVKRFCPTKPVEEKLLATLYVGDRRGESGT